MTLVGSFYGKFFARNLNLYLLKKNPEQWKTAQEARKTALKIPTASDEPKEPATTPQSPEKSAQAPPALKNKKRKARPADEIDEVFETLGKKVTGMNPGQGFAACTVTAALVATASLHALPVSTTHVSVGSLLGMGTAAGRTRWKTARQILLAWVITLPCGALLAVVAHFALAGL